MFCWNLFSSLSRFFHTRLVRSLVYLPYQTFYLNIFRGLVYLHQDLHPCRAHHPVTTVAHLQWVAPLHEDLHRPDHLLHRCNRDHLLTCKDLLHHSCRYIRLGVPDRYDVDKILDQSLFDINNHGVNFSGTFNERGVKRGFLSYIFDYGMPS